MWPLKTFLYFGFFWVTCAMALINPIWGVVNYMVVYQTDPTVTWWGAPLSDLGIRYSFTAAACTFAGLALARKRVPIVRPGFGWWECGILLIFAIACVSIVIGYGYSSGAQRDFSKLWKVLLFTLVLGRLAASRKNFHIVLWTLVAGSLYIGHDAYTAPARSFVMGRLERIGGPDFSTTSGAAAHLAAMLPLIGVSDLPQLLFEGFGGCFGGVYVECDYSLSNAVGVYWSSDRCACRIDRRAARKAISYPRPVSHGRNHGVFPH